MSEIQNQPSPKRLLSWFNPVGRQSGGWAFILNRVTALGLTFYLFLHLIVLYKLTQGPNAYDEFIALVHSPVFIFGELLVVAAGIIHALNGIRIALTSFGVGIQIQKQMLVVLMLVATVLILVFGIRMFTA